MKRILAALFAMVFAIAIAPPCQARVKYVVATVTLYYPMSRGMNSHYSSNKKKTRANASRVAGTSSKNRIPFGSTIKILKVKEGGRFTSRARIGKKKYTVSTIRSRQVHDVLGRRHRNSSNIRIDLGVVCPTSAERAISGKKCLVAVYY